MLHNKMLKRTRASPYPKIGLLVPQILGSLTLMIFRENTEIFLRLSLGQDRIL